MFSQVFADIGDEQSMNRVYHIFVSYDHIVGSRSRRISSLVLLDELGAGMILWKGQPRCGDLKVFA